MDKTTAQRKVRDTFKAAFDKKRYRDFISELLNGFDESKAQPMAMINAFKDHVKSCWRLGTFESPEGELADVLIVHLTESFKLERTRTALRDFVAHKLKRGEGEDNSYKEAALVAFVAPDLQSWRFSYVRMEYSTKRDPKTGKIKPDERLTPARRYSYLVGTDEECHTAQSRFLALLQNTTAKPTLSQIEESFSVESVTKEFFGEYARLFENTEAALAAIVKRDKAIRDDFKAKGVSTVDFAKKLLGQIVFLYFIQKKGWLGVAKGGKWGDGQRNFLRLLADRAINEKKCLFNDVFEPLFYDTLATDRGDEAWCKTFACRIPFLNGGLFEPLRDYDWEKIDIPIPNSLFSNTNSSKAGDIGTGILDVFDRYNFTVNEAEPLEKEVAIDPEMLGKVFENLIEDNRRKGLGAFYTPREIVHYMCQESLINYLDTTLNRDGQIMECADIEALIREGAQAAHYETARKDGTVSYQRRLPMTVEKNARALDDALKTITVCDPAIGSGAFPVGMMTEIVRARVTLTAYLNDIAERTPYHFKRHAIQNSLYGVDIDAGAVEIAKLRLWLSLVVDKDNVQKINPLPNLDYKVVVGNSLLGVERDLLNNSLFVELEKLKPKFFDESHRDKKAEFKAQIEVLIHKLTNGKEVFDFEIYFSEVFHAKKGFDVIIANPPYDVLNVTEGHQIERELLETIRSMPKYKSALGGKLNLFRLFTVQGLQILADDACLTHIIPYGFMCDISSKNLREKILKEKQLVFVEAFPERDDPRKRLFESAKMSTCIILVRNTPTRISFPVRTHYARCVRTDVPTVHLDYKLVTQLDPTNYSIPLMDDSELSIVKKLTSGNRRRIKEFGRCYEGEINLTFHKQYLREAKSGNAKLIKGAAVQRYLIKERMSQGEIQFLDENAFLKACKGPKTEHHAVKRIIMQGMTGVNEKTRLKMTILEEAAYCGNSVNYILLHAGVISYEYLLGILNSKLLNWYFKLFSTNSNVNGYEVDALPVAMCSQGEQEQIANLATKIRSARQHNAEADTSGLEREIDELVYALYGLTPEEIQLVEGQAK